jgi:hypothetical protein
MHILRRSEDGLMYPAEVISLVKGLYQCGISVKRISRGTGLDYETIRGWCYLKIPTAPYQQSRPRDCPTSEYRRLKSLSRCCAGPIQGRIWGQGVGQVAFLRGLLIEDCLSRAGRSGEGMRAVCIREVQKDLAQSSKPLIEAKLKEPFGLTEADGFKVFRDVIQTPGDGLMIFKGMNDYTSESIKSLEGFKRAWWEEAQSATQAIRSTCLRPTLRAQGSQLWFGWNPGARQIRWT